MTIDVFLSVGRTYTDAQEHFVASLESCLRANGCMPRTVGRSDFSSIAPLKRVIEVLDECRGAVILAFERSRADSVLECPGSEKESHANTVRLPTVWNQIEAAMSYTRGMPLLVIVQHGLKSEGLLEATYDWSVQWIELTDAALRTDEFQAVLKDWVKRVHVYGHSPTHDEAKSPSAGDVSIKQLVGGLTVPQLWGALAAIAAVLTGVATIAFRIGAAGG